MPQTPPTGPRVRVRRLVAGSFIAAFSAVSSAGLAAAPAEAGTNRAGTSVSPAAPHHQSWTPSGAASFAGAGASAGSVPPVSTPEVKGSVLRALPVRGRALPASSGRLQAIRAELDGAVALRLVTAEQADGFYAQIERRVAAGL
jgi:hypothetical protein